MKKLWLSALTAVTLMTGMSFGTAAWAGGRHDHWHERDRWERHDDYRRGWGPRPAPGYYRPYREIREVYYAPAPRYYGREYGRPERVYYEAPRRYDSGVRGSITVDF